jgi:hypothetical protein
MTPDEPRPAGRPLESNPLRWRYAEAYRLARLLVRIAGIARIALIVVVIVGLAVGLGGGFQTWLVGLFPTALFALSAWIGTILLEASGQFLQATIDTTVNTSPLLTDEQRAEIMGLK